jgi:predicted helicase
MAFITPLFKRSNPNPSLFDAFRKAVPWAFYGLYILDLGGNIRSSDTTSNVFDSKTGVAIIFLVKLQKYGTK